MPSNLLQMLKLTNNSQKITTYHHLAMTSWHDKDIFHTKQVYNVTAFCKKQQGQDGRVMMSEINKHTSS